MRFHGQHMDFIPRMAELCASTVEYSMDDEAMSLEQREDKSCSLRLKSGGPVKIEARL